MLQCVDLFSGIGGNALALKTRCNTVLFCENNKACYPTLNAHFPDIPIHDDVRTLADQIQKYNLPPIDMVCGGFPCQDISVSGAGKGIVAGTRSGLFFHVVDIVQKVRPPYVFLENVPAIRCRGLDIVLKSIADLHYTCQWGILSAHDVGAPHLRERWFLLAVNDSRIFPSSIPGECEFFEWSRAMDCRSDILENEPPILAARANSTRLHSLLGNAVVPKQAAHALSLLLNHNPNVGKKIGVLSEISGKLPFYGCLQFDEHRTPVVYENPPFAPISTFRCARVLLYPTPLNVLRACEGSVRRARALLLAGHFTYAEALAVAGKCPLLRQGAIPEMPEDAYRHVIPSIVKVKNQKSCYRERNVRWVEWLMGFPENWVQE